MARRNRGMKPIPGALSQAKDVFPITVIRNFLGIAPAAGTSLSASNNASEQVDLNLQFEDNEVFDIWAVKTTMELDPEDGVFTLDVLRMVAALYEDPDKLATIDLLPADGDGTGTPAANYQDDESLVYHHQQSVVIREGATVTDMLGIMSYMNYFVFPQPYTVARNLRWVFETIAILTASDLDGINLYAEIWGRRRNASDAEFKNIIYRQRF